MKTKQQIKSFLSSRPIKTDGAINKHVISLKEKHDGDTYCVLNIPFWPQNSTVVLNVLKLLDEILEWEPEAVIQPKENKIKVLIYSHYWNGAS